MPPSQSIEEKISLITRSTAETVSPTFLSSLTSILRTRPLVVYWGTAATGVPHFGYFIPLLKIRDLLLAGCRVKVLIADIHSLLDAQKSSFRQLSARTRFYTLLIKRLLAAILPAPAASPAANYQREEAAPAGSPAANYQREASKEGLLEGVEFVVGSEVQLTREYALDKLRLEGRVRVSRALRASSEVVRQQEDPEVGSLTYPLMQALDEEYLGVDMQLGGLDQRKIFMLARAVLPMLGYRKRLHMMTAMLPGLHCRSYPSPAPAPAATNSTAAATNTKEERGDVGEKMSSSDRESKIDFFDSYAVIKKKIRNSFAVPKKVLETPVLESIRLIILPVFEKFEVKRKSEFGGDRVYAGFEEIASDYEKGSLHPLDVKNALAKYLDLLVGGVRESILGGELKESFVEGYEEVAKELGMIKKKK